MEAKPAWKDIMKQEGVDDMTLLTKINNDAIAHNLKERFEADVIYVRSFIFLFLSLPPFQTCEKQTNIGNVLISMNPYKWVKGLYSEEVIHDYEVCFVVCIASFFSINFSFFIRNKREEVASKCPLTCMGFLKMPIAR